MSFAKNLRCRECHREYPLEARHVCDFCFGPVEVTYDYEAIQKNVSRERIERGPASLWRYRDFLPCDPDSAIDIGAGFTPLVRAKNLGRALGLNNLWIKNDTVNPTWSFKDRVVAVAASRARELGYDKLACASTGNLANSVSAHAAAAGMEAVVFIPHDLELGKVLGSSIYGPTLVKVRGNYDAVNRLCAELAGSYNWAFVNVNVRPYYSEGSKTLGFEVAEQLGWRAPDHCVVPIASGSLFVKIRKGLLELWKTGLIDEPKTRMSGAQAAGCSPVATAWQEGSMNFRPQRPNTIAKSLAIGNPADGYYSLVQLKETGGACGSVTDDEIVAGMKLLAETEGIFAETAGGVTIASLKQLAEQGRIHPDELTVAFITGAGFKTVEAVAEALNPPLEIDATIESFEAAYGARVAQGVA
ncbi:threonine synthase [Tepidiforma bonchosmolovskayae]|jgi:threonine synthase|uniref:Threonine synthase n=1 Tax=Tepidiforma bonchosmolovskayae TaxID=2601677 RepID=A0ABX6BY52_9CHLR|nr:threonine synthase [Tepidiforma bonchosmolovskayae]QFG01835.1 threonine synthase [Tepidiforma bonchosmolovskayae]